MIMISHQEPSLKVLVFFFNVFRLFLFIFLPLSFLAFVGAAFVVAVSITFEENPLISSQPLDDPR